MNNNKKEKTYDFQLDPTKFGPQGIETEYFIVPGFENDKVNDYEKLKDEETREFEISAIFSKNFITSSKIKASLTKEDGSSYILILDGKKSELNSNFGKISFFKNKENELSLINFKCKTVSINEALNKFNLVITPIIDYISFKANIPIVIQEIICNDIKNGIINLNFTNPYHYINLKSTLFEFHPEMIKIYALYREAKNNRSFYYKFLCYYKILDGIFNKLRKDVDNLAKEKNIELPKITETVPDIIEINDYNKDFVGMKIKNIFKDVFRKFRNKIAHFFLYNGDMINLSDYKTQKKYIEIIYLIETCCNIVIKNQNLLYDNIKQRLSYK